MNKKAKTYILLVFVLAVWGAIGYKVITGLSLESPEILTNNLELAFTPKNIEKPDIFSVEATVRDPFLGTLTRKNAKKTSVRSTLKSQPQITNAPQISYQGLVKNQSSSQQVFVVSINGNQHLLKRGQTVDNVKLVRGNSKEITVRLGNKQQTIALQ